MIKIQTVLDAGLLFEEIKNIQEITLNTKDISINIQEANEKTENKKICRLSCKITKIATEATFNVPNMPFFSVLTLSTDLSGERAVFLLLFICTPKPLCFTAKCVNFFIFRLYQSGVFLFIFFIKFV